MIIIDIWFFTGDEGIESLPRPIFSVHALYQLICLSGQWTASNLREHITRDPYLENRVVNTT